MSRVAGILDVHDLHVWNISTGIPVLTAHVHIGEDADPTQVLSALEVYVRRIGIKHSTIQICNPAIGQSEGESRSGGSGSGSDGGEGAHAHDGHAHAHGGACGGGAGHHHHGSHDGHEEEDHSHSHDEEEGHAHAHAHGGEAGCHHSC